MQIAAEIGNPRPPVGLGDIDDCPILALPGNPVAAAVSFIAFGRAVVLRLAGCLEDGPSPSGCRQPSAIARSMCGLET